VEKFSKIVRSSFQAQMLDSAVASLQHSEYIPDVYLNSACKWNTELATYLASMLLLANAVLRPTALTAHRKDHYIMIRLQDELKKRKR
jgi:hypothetical protein